MANYGSQCRTNSFRVHDLAALTAALAETSIEIHQIAGTEPDRVYLSYDEGGGWPTFSDGDLQLVDVLPAHLLDGQVAVLMEVGNEKLRYVHGEALAVNANGDIRRVALDDIYRPAAELGQQLTVASYECAPVNTQAPGTTAELAQALVALAQQLREGALDDLVIDLHTQAASQLNNDGPTAQLTWLCEQLGPAAALHAAHAAA